MTNNVNNTGPDSKPDAKKKDDSLFQAELLKLASQAEKKQSEWIKRKKAIRVIADLLMDNFEVQYDWHEVLEIELDDGRWVKVTLEEIEDPTPKDE